MQINSNYPPNFYPVVPSQSRNESRLPVLSDVAQTATKQLNVQRADTTSVVLEAGANRDGQQARFVRDFISSDRQLNEGNKPPFLPRSVQQYLYIEDLPKQSSTQQGQFLDEMV